jgi:hypothetical protein
MAVGTPCRGRPEEERHSAAAHQEHSVTGAVVTGAVVTGAVVTGMAAIGAAVIGAATNSSLPVDLVFRSSTGIPITGTIRMVITASPLTATAITAVKGTATTAIKGTAIKATALTTATKGTTATTKGTATAATKGTMATTKGIAPAATKDTATATTKGTATAITGYRKNARYRRDAANKWRLVQKLHFEIVRVLVRFDQFASVIVNANHRIN